jgi:rare lipoprotein A
MLYLIGQANVSENVKILPSQLLNLFGTYIMSTARSYRRYTENFLCCLTAIIGISVIACESKPAKEPENPVIVVPQIKETKTGLASFYGPGLEGKKTFGGEKFDSDEMVAAHPTYPLGTIVRVTNLSTQDTVRVRIADRGPTSHNRKEGIIIDLSRGAAVKLKMIDAGRQKVQVDVLEWGKEETGLDSSGQ